MTYLTYIIFYFRPLDLLPSNDIFSDEHNVQAVIDTLSLDLLGLSLYHISGENVVSGDPIAISNLLEVLEAIFLHLIEQDAESKDSTGNIYFFYLFLIQTKLI